MNITFILGKYLSMALGIKQFDIILNRKLLNNLECTFLFIIVIINV